MVFAELDRRARRDRAHRTKLTVQMLTTFAYGALGLSLAGPIVAATPFSIGHLMSLCFGLVCALVALYLAPEGERYG